MTETPRYATLRDYLRVIRASGWLILTIVSAFAAVAFAISISQTKSYEARASLSFRDLGEDLSLLGTSVPVQSTGQERAAASAQLINRPQIAVRVKKRLGTDLPVGELQSDISAEVSGISNIVDVVARSAQPEFAARLANAVATEASHLAKRQESARINRAIASLEREVSKGGGAPSLDQTLVRQQVAQLETVKRIAQPVQVAERAEVPTAPISPKPLRSTFLGGLLGIAIALVAAFARDSLDRRLRRVHDVHEELDLPVLSKVSDTAMGLSAFVQNGRPEPRGVDLESFRILRTNLEFLRSDPPLRSVLVTSALPEEGKSTVAVGLASAAAMAGKRTLLVECDLRRPSLAERIGLERSPGLSDYLAGKAAPQEILQEVGIGDPIGPNGDPVALEETGLKLVCIAAGTQAPAPAEMLESERCRDFLAKVSRAYEVVVLDTAPLLSVVDTLALVPQVDGVIMCVRLSQTTRAQAQAAKAAVDHLPHGSLGAVVTGLGAGDDETYGYYYAYTS
jgi:succinoglycan biosynthesis transport protein ExoP